MTRDEALAVELKNFTAMLTVNYHCIFDITLIFSED